MNCTTTVPSLISELTFHANGNIHTDHTGFQSGPITTEKEKEKPPLKLQECLLCFQIDRRWMEIFPDLIVLITFPIPPVEILFN